MTIRAEQDQTTKNKASELTRDRVINLYLLILLSSATAYSGKGNVLCPLFRQKHSLPTRFLWSIVIPCQNKIRFYVISLSHGNFPQQKVYFHKEPFYLNMAFLLVDALVVLLFRLSYFLNIKKFLDNKDNKMVCKWWQICH